MYAGEKESEIMSLTVTVTYEDMKEGWPSSCIKCPVALAIGRALLAADIPFDSVEVFTQVAFINHGSFVAYDKIELPAHVSKFIIDFDHVMEWDIEDAEPFSFDIEVGKEVVYYK